MIKQPHSSATIGHISSLRIDEYLGISDLEIPRLSQVSLFAGESGLLRSGLLEFLVNEYANGTSAEMHPYAWQTIRYVAKEETFYLGQPDLLATTTEHRRHGEDSASVVIRHMNEDTIQFNSGGNVTRFFLLANTVSVFKAGALLDPRLNEEFGQPMKMPVDHGDRNLVSPRIPVVRQTNGSYDYGYNYAESGANSNAEFRGVFRIGVDTLRLMLVMSSMFFLSTKANEEGKVAVLLIDGLDVAIGRWFQAEFWRLVFDEVRSRDVQLLATTNSLDCIAGFADAGSSIPEPMATYFRLEQGPHQTHCVDYDPSTLQLSIDTGVDPR